MQTIDEIKDKARPVLVASGVTYAALFGSYAKGTARPDSDIDILMKFKHPVGLFRFAGLQRELSEALDIPVDLVTEGGLSPYMRDQVLKELVPIYGQR